jgi:acyl-coenzyme A synthetase/AMP-(fatty) acid ligase
VGGKRCQASTGWPDKVPKQVRFLEELPKSAVGKILRKDLRALP